MFRNLKKYNRWPRVYLFFHKVTLKWWLLLYINFYRKVWVKIFVHRSRHDKLDIANAKRKFQSFLGSDVS